jgi:hypothetical protein
VGHVARIEEKRNSERVLVGKPEGRIALGRPRHTQWRSWLRHCTTSRKVACSIPDGISGTFH